MLAINLKYKVGGKEEKFLSPTHPGREDSLGVGMATHSSSHSVRIPWTQEAGGYSL